MRSASEIGDFQSNPCKDLRTRMYMVWNMPSWAKVTKLQVDTLKYNLEKMRELAKRIRVLREMTRELRTCFDKGIKADIA